MANRKTILAISSGGGHWVQLLRLRPSFAKYRTVFVSVSEDSGTQVTPNEFYSIRDSTRWNKVGLVITALQILFLMIRIRPNFVISTGAAPGYIAIRLGKLFGAKTIWIDSIANVEAMSMSGEMVQKYADIWLTQWNHLAQENGPKYKGAVL